MNAELQALVATYGFARILSLLADEASERARKKDVDGDKAGFEKWLAVTTQLSRAARDAAAIA